MAHQLPVKPFKNSNFLILRAVGTFLFTPNNQFAIGVHTRELGLHEAQYSYKCIWQSGWVKASV
jgi:hypothetical protein